MATKDVYYLCSECGNDFVKWSGRCPGCRAWNTLVEYKNEASSTKKTRDHKAVIPQVLTQSSPELEKRISTGSSEFDRALSGGLVAGSITLLGGDPGIGKSTLMVQVAHSVSGSLYISGEESEHQIALRAKRLGLKLERISFIAQTDVHIIAATIATQKPKLVIIDSIQTMQDDAFPSTPGSLVQVRECGLVFQRLAKQHNIPIILVGHVTKEGNIAGPKILEHMVDTVCYVEGKSMQEMRIVRTTKHRFGSTNEIGLFAMKNNGLHSLTNPSAHFINDESLQTPGSALSVIIDGNRPFIIEVQALTAKSVSSYPKRTASGYDAKRLELLLAILEQRAHISLSEYDVYINIVGGLVVKDNGIDCAIACAIASSHGKWVVPEKLCIVGECGLAGEIRSPLNNELRKNEVERLGYTYFTQPKTLSDALRLIKKGTV